MTRRSRFVARIVVGAVAALIGCGGDIPTTRPATDGQAQVGTGRGPAIATCYCDCGDAPCQPKIPPGSEGDAMGYSCAEQCAIWGPPAPQPPPPAPPPMDGPIASNPPSPSPSVGGPTGL
jgi:hypothetical protein